MLADGTFRSNIFSDNGDVVDPMNVIASSNTVVDTDWHHFLITFEAGDLTIFLDGVRDPAQTTYYNHGLGSKIETSTSLFSRTSISLDKFRIGTGFRYCGTDGYVEQFDGAMDDVRIYDGALSDQEVEALFEQTRPSSPPSDGLLLHYTFDSDEGGFVTDLSGNGYTGNVHGATWTAGTSSNGLYAFDGQNDFLSTPDAPGLDTPFMSVSCWFNANVLPSSGSEANLL
ncbi:MAG: hypothetical protein OSB41_07075, partial [Kiritimatiellae bacterium]|nr:hypothetical protein [Kiritimatiellia bacterium]